MENLQRGRGGRKKQNWLPVFLATRVTTFIQHMFFDMEKKLITGIMNELTTHNGNNTASMKHFYINKTSNTILHAEPEEMDMYITGDA